MNQIKKILITVKTYPNPSTKHKETVCVAGVLLEDPPSWIRIYPVPFRNLPHEKKFKKYQIIEAQIKRNTQDFRPESYKINADSINILGELGLEDRWEKRKEILLKLLDSSMCEIQREQEKSGKSLGMFKPASVDDLTFEPTRKEWNQGEKNILSQSYLFHDNNEILGKIPYKFKFHYHCLDSHCRGHNQTIIDWEIAQLYRNLRNKSDEKTLIKKMKEKYLEEICGSSKDTYFIVGNQYEGPKAFLILGIFWPPIETQTSLF